ncbi:MAG: hypothetical protein E7149_02185 [Rikenellaceae bacterium]|nr:hypothetical protein [Rikenellaceae bacterium]
MKKQQKLFGYMVCALLLLGAASCEKEGNELSAPMTTGEKIGFSATIDDSASRTILAEDGATVHWKGDEQIGVFYTTTPTGGSNTTRNRNACYTVSSFDKATATLTGDIEWVEIDEGVHKFQMYYPYNETVTSSSAAFGTLPAEQVYDPAGWDISDYAFMVSGTAQSSELGVNPTVTFRHLFSVLRFNVVNQTGKDLTIEKLTLTSKSGLILAGDFQANIGKSKTYEALHNATEVSNTDGRFITPASSITTTLPEATVVKAGEAMDIRLMINAGFKDGSTTEYYLDGETLEVELYTTGNPVWTTEFKAGKLDRGARATKKLTVSAFDDSAMTVTAITPDHDAESEKFYLNTVATATGLNLGTITKLTVDGKEVPATGLQVSNSQIIFKIPDTIERTEAASCNVVGYDSNDNAYELGSIKVYPFFYYKDVQLGLGSNSSSTYTEYASQNAFFVPDLGKVISANEWYDTPIDSYAVTGASTGANSALSDKNTLNKTNISTSQYYGVMPYLFFLANSDNFVSSAAPTNSNSVLRNHYYLNGGSFKTLLSSKVYGTPIIYYRVAPDAWATKVIEGTLETMNYTGSTPNSTTPYLNGTNKTDGVWTEGSVLVMGYVSYAMGAKPSKVTDCAKFGFIHIKEVTCADLTTGLAKSPREGYIKFDFYWSKPINDAAAQPTYGDDGVALPTPTPPVVDGERAAGSFTVASVAEFSALTPLVDGDEIIWKNGTYKDVNLTIDSEQTITQGITFRAESNGGVLFIGNSTLAIKTDHTTVRGFHWQDPLISAEHLVRFHAGTSYCTLEECAITGYNTTADYTHACKWVSLNGDHHTVQHCSFMDKRDRGALLVVWFDEGVTPNHTIQYNHFTRPTILIDPTDGDPANEQETIRVGDSANSLSDGKVTVANNYFYQCYGESAEVVSSKSCTNLYKGNYFHECRGTLTLRHGNNCTIEGNYFYGNGVEESGGVRVIGEGHTVRGNHFEKLTGIGYKAALSLVRGQENAALSGYAQVKNALIENNTFNECVLAVHANYGSSSMTMPVISTTMRGNTIVAVDIEGYSVYAVRYESTTPEAEITWEDNTIYGKFKNNYFGLTAVKTAPALTDVSSARKAIANAAGVAWSMD